MQDKFDLPYLIDMVLGFCVNVNLICKQMGTSYHQKRGVSEKPNE